MDEQARLPGTAPSETRITGAKLMDALLYTGQQMALDKVRSDLRAAQKQYPAVGLALALALVERDLAEATLKTNRIVLSAAAKAGLDFDGRALVSGLEGDALVVRATDEPAAA